MTVPSDSERVAASINRHPSERRRASTVAVIGLATSAGLAFALPWQATVLAGWDLAAIGLLAWAWRDTHGLDATQTQALATREDDSRAATRAILVLSAVISLFGVGFALAKAKQLDGSLGALLTVESVATVVLSWSLVHLVYMLRYAHLYYDGAPGGVDFNSEEAPDYGDFAYLALTIGMTYQVSDTNLSSRMIRRALLGHAVLSYLFGTIIVALTINVLAGLVR